AGEVLAAPQRPAPAGHRLRGAAAAPAAPEPARLRQAPRHLDVGPARSGLLREGLDAPSAQHRDPPPGHPPPGGFLAAGQALDHQPRPRRRAQKKARHGLLRLAARHPGWVRGYQDECWWSRLAQPDLHAWAEEEPLRLVELPPPRDDPDRKALCCYGLFRSDTEQMLLRFVDG